MYAHIAACTGWQWDYIRDHIDLPRLQALTKQWREYPPPFLMLRRIAKFLGLQMESTDKAAELSSQNQDEQSASLMEVFPVAAMPRIMEPEEYLAQRCQRE